MELTDVSKTAIATLRSHVLEHQKSKPLIIDPMVEFAWGRLASLRQGRVSSNYSTENYPRHSPITLLSAPENTTLLPMILSQRIRIVLSSTSDAALIQDIGE